MEVALQEQVRLLNSGQTVPLVDVNGYLVRALRQRSLVLVVPWVTDYLRLLKNDAISR